MGEGDESSRDCRKLCFVGMTRKGEVAPPFFSQSSARNLTVIPVGPTFPLDKHLSFPSFKHFFDTEDGVVR